MLQQIRALQLALDISDAQLLLLARTAAGARLRSVAELAAADAAALLDTLHAIESSSLATI